MLRRTLANSSHIYVYFPCIKLSVLTMRKAKCVLKHELCLPSYYDRHFERFGLPWLCGNPLYLQSGLIRHKWRLFYNLFTLRMSNFNGLAGQVFIINH